MKARFRLKSSKKTAAAAAAAQAAHEQDPFGPPLPPPPPALDYKLPTADFRSSRILPDLGKRFSLLARKEDPAIIKHRLAQLREANGQDGAGSLTAEEEDLVYRELQELREEDRSQAHGGPSPQTAASSVGLSGPSGSAHASRSLKHLHGPPATVDRALAKSPSGSSKFFGGGADEAEYIRRAKRSASNRNLSNDLGGGEPKTNARRRGGGGSGAGGGSAPQSPVDQDADAGPSLASGLPSSTSYGSLLSEADSTVEYAPLQDLPSPNVVAPPSFGALSPPPTTDRSRRRKSLLDSLTPAQMKRISATLALVEDAVYGTEGTEGGMYENGRSPSATHSRTPSDDHRALSTVIEPSGGAEVLASHPSDEPSSTFIPRRPPGPGQAKRVPSSSGYVPGPRPMRNRSISATSNPSQLAAPSGGSSASARLSPNASVSSDIVGNSRTSSSSVAGSVQAPSERDRESRGSYGSESSLSSSKPRRASSIVDPYQAGLVPSPLGGSWVSRTPSDIAQPSPPLSTLARSDPLASHHAAPLEDGSRKSSPEHFPSARDRSGEQTASPEASSSSLQLDHEELLDSHVSQFADRLPSSFDLNHRNGPIAPSTSSRALHGHQLSHSSMGSSAQQQHPHWQRSSLAPLWDSRPESADSDAFLPPPIEAARYSSQERSVRSRPTSGSSLSSASSCGSSFHSDSARDKSVPDPLAIMLEQEPDLQRSSSASSPRSRSDVAAFADVAEMEKLLLTASGLTRHDLALVHRKLIEFQPSAPGGGDLGSTTPRARASDPYASQTSMAEEASQAHPALSSDSRLSDVVQPASLQQNDVAPAVASPLLSGPSSAPASHRTQRSRASSILDPELSSSSNAVGQLRASDSPDARPISPGTSSPQRVDQLGVGRPAEPVRTRNGKHQSTTPALASSVAGAPSRSTSPPPSPMAERDPAFEDDFRARIDAADSVLRKSPSMPRIVSGKLGRKKSLKNAKAAISQPQLISSTSKVESTAIAISPPPPALPERSKSMSQRFKQLTGRRKSKENLKDAFWMQDLPPSPPVNVTSRAPSSPLGSPSQAEQRPAGNEAFIFPSRSPLVARAATESPPPSPLDAAGKKTLMGRLRPRKTLDPIATSADPPSPADERVLPHTAPVSSVRQFSGPPMEGSVPSSSPSPTPVLGQPTPGKITRSASFQSGHSHASSVHALFDAASKLGIDAQDVDALLRRSTSISQLSTRTRDSSTSRIAPTPPMTRAASSRSHLAVGSISEEPREASDGQNLPVSTSARSGLSQASGVTGESHAGSVMRRTVILPQENGRLSFQAPVVNSDAAFQPPLPSPVKVAGFSRSPAKARLSVLVPPFAGPESPLPSPRHDLRLSAATRPSLSPSEGSFSRAGHSSANASFFDLYHGQTEDDDNVEYYRDGSENGDRSRLSRTASASSLAGGVQPGQAVEILEMSNGDVLYSVLQGLRDIDDIDDVWDSRSDAASMMDRPPSSLMDEPVQLTFRGQRYDGPDLSRRSLFKPSRAPRPETKIFYSSSKAVADLINEISHSHDQGQLQFTTSPTSPSFHRSLSFNSGHLPLNVPKRSVSVKRPPHFHDGDSRFSDAPSNGESDYSVSARLDRMMDSVIDQAVAAGPGPSRSGSMTLDVPQPPVPRYTAKRF